MLFKVMGIIVLFLSSAAFGFLKSFAIRKRAEKLSLAARSVKTLASRIKAEKTEMQRALKICFREETVKMQNGSPVLNKAYLDNEDITLFEEFFEKLGLSDINTEYERISLFASLIEKRGKDAAAEADKLCKLYNSLGVLFGIFISIFFL